MMSNMHFFWDYDANKGALGDSSGVNAHCVDVSFMSKLYNNLPLLMFENHSWGIDA